MNSGLKPFFLSLDKEKNSPRNNNRNAWTYTCKLKLQSNITCMKAGYNFLNTWVAAKFITIIGRSLLEFLLVLESTVDGFCFRVWNLDPIFLLILGWKWSSGLYTGPSFCTSTNDKCNLGSWICVPSLFTSKQRASLVQASLVRVRKPTHPESCLINYRTQWSWRCLGLQDKEAVYIQYKYVFFQLPHYRLKSICPAYTSPVGKCMYDRKLAINCFISLQ